MSFGDQYALNSPWPLYEFGYGLSYSTFVYSDLSLSKTENVSVDDSVEVRVNVSNVSGRDGMEVVQVYVKDVIASVDVPNISLKGFSKVEIKARETVEVSIVVKVADLGVWDREIRYVVEPGEVLVFVGASSSDFRANGRFVVV